MDCCFHVPLTNKSLKNSNGGINDFIIICCTHVPSIFYFIYLIKYFCNDSFHYIFFLTLGWNELLIAGFSHRSIVATDGILLATGLHIHRNSAHAAGLGIIFDRVLSELVSKMRDMKMDRTELGCLRAIVLFNPGHLPVFSLTRLNF